MTVKYFFVTKSAGPVVIVLTGRPFFGLFTWADPLFFVFFTAEVIPTTPTQIRLTLRKLCAGPPEAAGAAGGRSRGAGGPSFRCAAVVVTRRSSRSGPMMALLALAATEAAAGGGSCSQPAAGRMGGTEVWCTPG